MTKGEKSIRVFCAQFTVVTVLLEYINLFGGLEMGGLTVYSVRSMLPRKVALLPPLYLCVCLCVWILENSGRSIDI